MTAYLTLRNLAIRGLSLLAQPLIFIAVVALVLAGALIRKVEDRE